MRFAQELVVAAGKARAHLAVLAGAGAGGDVVEDDTRGLAPGVGPLVRARRARAPLALLAGAGAGADVVEDDTRGLARGVAPVGLARGDEVGLALQDHAVVEHLQPVRGKRRAGRGDVDDHLGSAGRGRAFSGAGALDDAVVDDAMAREEVASGGTDMRT